MLLPLPLPLPLPFLQQMVSDTGGCGWVGVGGCGWEWVWVVGVGGCGVQQTVSLDTHQAQHRYIVRCCHNSAVAGLARR